MEPIDNEKFLSMYNKYNGPLRTIARNRGMPYDEIDDVIQETFISYTTKYGTDDPNRAPILVTILKNKCIDYYRKIHYESVSSDSDEGRFILDTLVSKFGGSTEDKIGKKEFHKKVRECISGMKAEWRDVILYCCILHYSSDEAGKILGISGTACRSRLLRAREYINKELGKEFHEYYD